MVQLMRKLEQKRTEQATTLPMAVETRAPRPSLARSSADAAFVSQLLAARDRMAPQRHRRMGSNEGAIGAYASGARMGERRMPAGFRKTVVV